MKPEDKLLLLQDLCARLPYGVKVKCPLDDELYTLLSINWNKEIVVIGFMMDEIYVTSKQKLVDIKPFLRPMSSMTDKEREEYEKTLEIEYQDVLPEPIYHKTLDSYYYLLEHHFDFRGLIPAGLAIEVTEENNPYKD